MRQRWLLNIKDFGKIKSASIGIAPMVLLVGENNSGKSYLVSLMWGVLARGRTLFPKEPPSGEAYRQCAELLRSRPNVVTEPLQNALVQWFNSLLKARKNELVREVFTGSGLSVGHLSISEFKRLKPLALKWDVKAEPGNWRYSSGKDTVRFPVVEGVQESDAEVYRRAQYLCWNLIMGDLSAPLFPPGAGGNRRVEGETLYLPAARSGFMMTYRSLVSEVMDVWGGGETQSIFTLPVVRFLQGLADNRHKAGARLSAVADYLEEKLLQGRVNMAEAAVNQYTYQPQGTKTDLPYHLASSLVGELSPLVIFLRSNITYRSLILEEPEAHLHPELQKVLTCALSRIVTKGVPVWCTTHSETVFQQVNNLMRLSQHPDKKSLMTRYGYQADDLLHPDDVLAYQFILEGGQSRVEPLARTENGFVAPTFNESLLRLSEETLAFMQDE